MKKGKVVPVHAMKAHRGIGGIAVLIVNRGTRWWLVVSIKNLVLRAFLALMEYLQDINRSVCS
jgi:hypothetical protein